MSKSPGSCTTVLTSNQTLILFPPGFLNNVLLFSFPSSIVNISLSCGNIHSAVKESTVTPILKKPTLDKEELSNCRPISNLSVISKIIERVVKSRLTEYVCTNNFLNPAESPYCKHHSTETVLLCINNYLVNVIDSQKYQKYQISSRSLCCIWHYWHLLSCKWLKS